MDESNRRNLITTRAVAKASLTRLAKFIKEYNSDSETQPILVRLQELPKIRDKFEGAQTQLELFEDFELHADDREHFETMYFDVEARMNTLLSSTGNNACRSQGQHSNSSPTTSRRTIKLPTIRLPSFSGDVTQFRHFHDTFVSLIVNNESLDNIQRFHYLLSSLSGEAHSIIANIPVTSANFQGAFETICTRYNNPRLIASAHVNQLLNLPHANKASASELRALLSQTMSNLNAIKALDLSVPLEELLISQLILEKTEISIRREYESTLDPKAFPTLQQLYEFLETKCKSIEIVNSSRSLSLNDKTYHRTHDPSTRNQKTAVRQSYISTNSRCVYCKQAHTLYKCQGFIELAVADRSEFVKRKGLCFNCLKDGHKVTQCKSGGCRTCGNWHHTLIHKDDLLLSEPDHRQQEVAGKKGGGQCLKNSANSASYCSLKVSHSKQILLSTAIVQIEDRNGKLQLCRALLDSGSQSCFISEACAQRLKLRRESKRIPIQGIGDTVSETKHIVSLKISSSYSNFTLSVDCFVLPKVTDNLPEHIIQCSNWNLPTYVQLADPTFYQPGKIDLLLGAEVVSHIQRPGKLVKDFNYPVLQETELGWVLYGRYEDASCSNTSRRPALSCFAKTDTNIERQLRKFWEVEELDQTPRTREENECEEHFVKHTTRDSSGRFMVRLPFRENPQKLGDSHQMAAKRFYLLERRMNRNHSLKQDYINFMDEYQDLDHMEPVPPTAHSAYYMPHHAVVKDSSSTTKTRVVFDCSAKSSNGISLNDLLLVGPTIQQDLCSIIARFRTHSIAFTADIAKMYRQIQVDPRDLTYQRILWRRNPTDSLQKYQLKTVTYGMASAPFLATRCLQQLAEDEIQVYPKEAGILMNDFYVDDCMSGCATVAEALQAQQNLVKLLHKGGFSLRKWCSNSSQLLENIAPELRESQLPLRLDSEVDIRTLGLLWHPGTDSFQIVNNKYLAFHNSPFTKRLVLSIISSIFDPLGLISPVVILCKMFLQRLWQENLTWDEVLSLELIQLWQNMYDRLPMIDNIRISRRILADGPLTDIQLHGFCDASEKAYGSCIYIRSTNEQGSTTVKLLCSKSRVSPLKKLSLPRLELCGALLLARLYKRMVKALNLKISNVYLWTDSTIVLAWLSAPSTRWKTFVGNRVSEIQDATANAEWRHVISRDNPADLISRGMLADFLMDNQFWWEGPSWLLHHPASWPKLCDVPANPEIPEEKQIIACHVLVNKQDDITTRFSRLRKLQRVVAYCFRFMNNCRKPLSERITGDLSLQELQLGLHQSIKMAQRFAYATEIHQLEHNKPLHNASKLKTLNPILDNEHLLRVGGRLQNSDLNFDEKHQIILPQRHHLTKLIIEHEHQRMLHASCQLLLSSLRQQYWIVNGRTVVRHILHQCITCQKLKAETAHQLMGQLPRPRVNAARPFLNCGVDFTGPFYIRSGSRRSKTKDKCYVAIFVCLAVKAIHLEVVSNLSSQAFLAALRRFVSRRGRCQNIYSDNGLNFVGVERELRELQEFFKSNQLSRDLRNFSDLEGITWHFIPPRAPHFGGIWEAGVKSFKYHLRRTMGVMILTLEELTTLTCQIEACLNSRPLIPLSSDPSDPEVLTPGHYLIGQAITSIPQPDLGNAKLSLLSRWETLQHQLQLFWRRWSSDYLHHLQQRSKWTLACPSVKPGALVIVKEDNLPPLSWKLAVIEEVHPGPDELVRVVTVRTPHGLYKRPITKLCLLPEESEL